MAQPASVKYAHAHKHVAECPKLNEHTHIYPSPPVNTQAISVLWRHIWFHVDAFLQPPFHKVWYQVSIQRGLCCIALNGEKCFKTFWGSLKMLKATEANKVLQLPLSQLLLLCLGFSEGDSNRMLCLKNIVLDVGHLNRVSKQTDPPSMGHPGLATLSSEVESPHFQRKMWILHRTLRRLHVWYHLKQILVCQNSCDMELKWSFSNWFK